MRLSLSIALWLTVAVLTVLGAHGWIQLRQEAEDLDTAAQRQLSLVATAIRSAVENALRDHQEPDVEELLEQLEVNDPAVDVFVIGVDGAILGRSGGTESNLDDALALIETQQPTSQVEKLDSGEFAVVTPLRISGSTEARLVVIRPLKDLEADLREERRAGFVSVGLLIAALLLLIGIVVRVQVQRPMDRIIAGVRQISKGDLSTRIRLDGTNEFGELSREFDAMTGSLEQARLDLASAAEARERMDIEMQRANRMAIVGEIAAMLAHEIGSPLQVLNGRARDLAAREDLPADATRSAAIMVEQTDRVHHIVERLLDVARRKAPEMVELDIRESILGVVELVSTQARRAGVNLEVDCGEVPRLRGDAAQVQQVLLNLVQNALRATPSGGSVRVSVSRSQFARSPDLPTQQSVAIEVVDSGSGMQPAVLDRVFEPFFTAWADERSPKGTGLGLAVVRSIVTAHGGLVSAATAPGGAGAHFVVHFPVRSTEANHGHTHPDRR